MKKNWDDFIKPVVVLAAICLAVSALLAVTNSFTAPIIAANAAREADAARIELLPEADAFTQVAYEGAGVTEVYKANNGAGYTISGIGKGYGGDVVVMVAFGPDNTIVATKILESSETAGIGTKVTEGNFVDQYIGKEAREFELGTDVAGVATATITSGAVNDAVNNASKAYNEVALGVIVEGPVELTEEEEVALLLTEGEAATVSDTTPEGVNAVYIGDAGTVVLIAEADGYEGEPVVVYVAIGTDGNISALKVDASTQTKNLGTKVEKEEFTSQFIGKNAIDDVAAVGGATISSNATKEAINKALLAYNEVEGA